MGCEMRYKTVLEKNGKVALPKGLIKQLGLKEGDELLIRVHAYCYGWQITITSIKDEVINEL